MKKGWVVAITLVLFVAQISVPVAMILRYERAVRSGKVFRFKTQPVDPADAFRGRYIALALKPLPAPESSSGLLKDPANFDLRFYATLEDGEDGFARVTNVGRRRPEHSDYLEGRLQYGEDGKPVVAFLIDRYYVEEGIAPAAERAARESSRRGVEQAAITVRVYKGLGVVEQLFIEGVPLREYLSGRRSSDPPAG